MTFTKGYQTRVGERGCQLSGGEKQRLAIARAILKKPDILLLDEATSSVDSVTEEQIQTSLDEICKGRSTFVIAHRLSTILKADQILVIDGGKLVESGKHSELIKKKGGVYQKLWRSQLKLQGEQSRSRSRSKARNTEDSLALINDVNGAEDSAALAEGSGSPADNTAVQTPEEGSAPTRGRVAARGFGTVTGVGRDVFESIRSRFVSTSPAPANRDAAAGDGEDHEVQHSASLIHSLDETTPGDRASDQQHDGACDNRRSPNRRLTQSEPKIYAEEDSD